MDNDTDFLIISYSSTNYVGHRFGVNSKQVQDTCLKLEKDIERSLNFLDKEVLTGNYTVFLTADHGTIICANLCAQQQNSRWLFRQCYSRQGDRRVL